MTALLLSACTGSAPPKPGGSGGAAGHVGLGGMGGSSTSTGGTGAGGATAGHAGNGGGGTSAGGAAAGGSGGSTAGTGGNAGAAGGSAGSGLAGAGGATGGAAGSGAGGTSAGTGGTAGASAGGAAGSPTGAGGATGGSAGIAGGAGGGLGGGYQPPASPLTFDVSTTADPVAAGGRLLYTVTIGNISNVSVPGVTLTWLLPTGVQFHYTADSAPDASSGWNVNNGYFSAGSQATWNLGSLAAGSMRTVTINAQVLTSLGDGDSISASFKLAATGINPATYTKAVQVYAESSAQLSTGTTINPVVPGKKFTLDIDVGQIGTNALANAALQTTVSPGLTVISISDGGTQTSPGVISWNVGSVGVGLATHRSIDLTVDGNVPAGAILTTRTTLTYDGGLDVDAAADYAIRVIAAAPFLNLVVAETPTPTVPGARLAYTATVTNTSTRSIDGVALVLRGPAGLQFHYTADAAPDASSGWNVNNGYFAAGSEATWSIGTIASGDSRTVFINEQVLANTVGNGNLIRADFQTSATGIDVIDDVRTAQVYDSPGAQLTLGATANPVTNAQAFSYTLDVGQIGTTPLANAQLKLWLPQNVSVGAVGGGGAQDASGAVVWNIGTIPVGANGHYTVAVTGDGTAVAGTILYARAALTYDGGAEVDVLTDYAIPVVAAAQGVTVTVTASPNPAVPGSRLLYTATVTNTTARSVDGVSLLMLVPVGLQFHYTADADPDASSGWNVNNGYFAAGYEAVWSLGTMAAGATQIITINAQVLTSLLGGSLIPTEFWLSAGGQDAPVLVPVTVPAN